MVIILLAQSHQLRNYNELQNAFKVRHRHQYNVVDTVLVFLVLALNIFQNCSSVSIAEFDQEITD